MSHPTVRWVRAETYAAAIDCPRQFVIGKILDSQLNGVVVNDEWFVVLCGEDNLTEGKAWVTTGVRPACAVAGSALSVALH